MSQDISTSINKVDNVEKLSGGSLYINDYKIEDLYHAVTVRSTISKGTITKKIIPKLPEDVYIVDADDIPGNNFVQIIFEDWPVFAKDEVNYYGEPIMLLVGKDRSILENIRKSIVIEYSEADAIVTMDDAVKRTSPAITYTIDREDYPSVAKKAKCIIRETYATGLQEQVYIEPQGLIGQYSEECITLTGSYQCPYYVKNAVMNTLGFPEDRVRVVQSVTGGAFGGKEEFPSLISCQIAVACNKLKKSIKLIYERKEDIEVTTKRHPAYIEYEAALDENDHIAGIKMDVKLDGGAYIGLSGVVLQRSMIASCGVYNFGSVLVNGAVYATNVVPNGAFRGFGAPQTFFALEQFMNHIAKQLGKDPVQFKLEHLAARGDATSTGGTYRDPILMPEMISEIKKMSGYDRKFADYAKADSYKGIGMSLFLHGCGFTGSGEADHIKAKVKLKCREDAKVEILISNVDMGQGFKTTMLKVVSHTLSIPLDQVIFNNPDTRYVPDSGPTVASRSTMIVGHLLAEASEKLLKKEGPCEVEANFKQPEYIKWDQEKLIGDAYPAYSWGVNVIEVEVDKDTYETKITGAWTVHDIGKAIDDRIIKGQVDGGLLQGVSYGLLEKMEMKNGRVQQNTVTDYIIPTAADFVTVENKLFDNPYSLGPFGAKGAGELTLIGGAPAVAAAIEQAIGDKKIQKIPVTPEYVSTLID